MLLPNRERAYIPHEKIISYLLSQNHAVGKSKAKFFRKIGFDETNINLLEQGLLKIAQNQEIMETVASVHGSKYVIDGLLQTPNSKLVTIRTVWIIENQNIDPRFVTAYPLQT